jgi:dienelactone hydrolase
MVGEKADVEYEREIRVASADTVLGARSLRGRYLNGLDIEPWLGLFGDLDQSIPPSEVEQLRQAVTNTRVPTEVVRYSMRITGHGFNCDDRPAVLNVAAAGNAWERTLNWLRSHLTAGDQQEG